MIEAMSTGTPVVGWRCGSVPEVIDEGITGFVVSSMDEATAAIDRVAGLSRLGVRAQFLERFTARRMAADYCDIYEKRLSSMAAAQKPYQESAIEQYGPTSTLLDK